MTGPTRAEAFRRNRDVHMAHCGRKRQTYKFRRTRGMQRGIHDDVLAGFVSCIVMEPGFYRRLLYALVAFWFCPIYLCLLQAPLYVCSNLCPWRGAQRAYRNWTVQDLRIKVYPQGSKCHYVIWP